MKKALICLALGAVILGAPCAPAQAPPTEALTKPTTFEPVELRFAVYAPPTHPLVKSLLEPWTQRVAERTEGRVTVAIYGGQSLCKATETADAVASGIADAGFGFLEYHPGRFPLTDVTGLPFLGIDSCTTGSRVIWQLYEGGYFGDKWKEFKVLWLPASAPVHFFTVDRPVRTSQDFKGLKMRTSGWYTGAAIVEAMRGTAIQMSVPESYMALERKTIDGELTTFGVVVPFKRDKLLKYYTVAPIYAGVFFAIMNRDHKMMNQITIQEVINIDV